MALHLVGKISITVGFEPMALYLVGKLSTSVGLSYGLTLGRQDLYY